MAFPSTPLNLIVQQGNLQVYLSWDLSAGATSYNVYRSTDNVTFTNIASPAVTNFFDTTVSVGTQYYYKVTAVNLGGESPATASQSIIPAPVGEMSLGQIRQMSQQRADRVNSQFVTTSEWNAFINQAMYELYDLLITVYEDYFKAPNATFTCNGSQAIFPLPNGQISMLTDNSAPFTPAPFYKMLGVDLALNNAANAYVTINRYNFVDRNRFVYPNTASTIYGVFNLQYRIMGTNIEFIPTPSGGQKIRLQYIPRLPVLLADTDLSTIGFSGWLQYVIVRAAKYALDKEESDTTKLDQELLFLKGRIEETAFNRDVGMADTISDTRQGNWADGWWGGRNGAIGGWAVLIAPVLLKHDVGNNLLTHSVDSCQIGLGYITFSIAAAYLFYNFRSKLSGRINFSGIRNFISNGTSSFVSHIQKIIGLSSGKKMPRIHTQRIITSMTDVKSVIEDSKLKLVGNSSRDSIFSTKKKSGSAVTTFSSAPRPAFGFVFLNNILKKSCAIFIIDKHDQILTINQSNVKEKCING